MSSFTVHRPPLRFLPAMILAVFLLLGGLAGRYTGKYNPSWISATAPAIGVLALVQPSALTLASAGFTSGILLETLRTSKMGGLSAAGGGAVTLRGKVIKAGPSLFGQSFLVIRVIEAWGRTRVPLNFHLNVNVPVGGDLVRGTEILMRASFQGSGSLSYAPVVQGRTVSDGWLARQGTLSPLYRARARFSRILQKFGGGPASGLMGAITLGDRWRVDARTRDVLRRTGTYHLLAISGVHVGAAFLPFVIFARLGGSLSMWRRPLVSRAFLFLGSLGTVACYLCFTGLSSPALRATLYLTIGGSAVLVGRCSSPMTVLSWCVMILFTFSSGPQPDLSLVLSALAVTGIILTYSKDGGPLSGIFRMTLGAVLFTLPIVVWMAGGISIIAPAGNILAGIPFGLILIPGAVLMDLASLIPGPLTSFMADLWLKTANPVLVALAHLADLPFSFLSLSRAGCLTASLAGFMGLVVWRKKGYRPGMGTMVFLAVAVISGGAHLLVEKIVQDDLVILFPGMRQADGAIVRCEGRTVLIDCGPGGLPGRSSPVTRALLKLGVRRIDAVFLSHLHPDHAGGLEDVMAMWPVDVLYLPDRAIDKVIHDGIRKTGHAGTRVRLLRAGDRMDIGSLEITVYGPGDQEGPEADMNRRSLQLLLKVDTFRGFFTGDAGWDQVQQSLDRIARLDLLKIPHHGSKKGFPPRGMDATVRRIRESGHFVSVCPSQLPGRGYLPAREVVTWFQRRGVNFVYTDDTGVKILYKKTGPVSNRSTVVDKHYRF